MKKDTQIKRKISNQLILLIKEKYKTIEKFCYENEISKGTISDILNNKKLPRLDTLKNILSKLGIKLSDFFKDLKE